MRWSRAGLFAGAAVYVNLVEHPARVSCGSAVALAEFRPAYRRGAVMQATLAAIGTLAGIGAWLVGHGPGWLVGALLLGSVIPWTLLVIFPTNARLLDPAHRSQFAAGGRVARPLEPTARHAQRFERGGVCDLRGGPRPVREQRHRKDTKRSAPPACVTVQARS